MGNCLSPSSFTSASDTELVDVGNHIAATPTAPEDTAVGTRARPSLAGKGTRRLARGSSLVQHKMNLHVLRKYAQLPNPAKSLPANVLLTSNSQTIAIFDAYPKAKYHFLVIPRYPFPVPGLSDAGSWATSAVRLNALDDLKSLLRNDSTSGRSAVLDSLASMATEVEEMVKDEMLKTEGFEWDVDIGFHAIPSMK
jgi:hypothetical protein